MKALVLGHTGMLGHMVKKYLEGEDVQVDYLVARFKETSFVETVEMYKGDYIINCIGAIPQRTNKFQINTDLPIWLSNKAHCRVIHPGTDCEMDDDPYGISKRLASEYIQLYSTNTKILKTSIVGPEQGTNYGLMEWFSSQQSEVNGYTKAIWNGNTTLEWAKQCYVLMNSWESYPILTILEGEPISKYNMLNLFKEYYDKTIEINPVELGRDKCLMGTIKTKSLKEQLSDLKKFTTSSHYNQ